MAKPSKQPEQKEQKSDAQFYRDLARDYYNEAYDMEEANSPDQQMIDTCWRMAASNFYDAFVLGHKEAPFGLFKCFDNGDGVTKDSLLAKLFYGVALNVKDPKCQKLDPEDIPVIPQSLQPAIAKVTKLFLDTNAKIQIEGASTRVLVDNMELFNDNIALWTGKLVLASKVSKENAVKMITQFHADHPGWHYLGLGDEGEFADPVDDVGAAAAGVGGIHFDGHHG